jgi:integrase
VQEIGALELFAWVEWIRLREPPLSEKTLKNVLADIGQFLRWLERLEEYAPTIPDARTVALALDAIPNLRRGLFLARGYMELRPSEARRLDVADLRDEGRALQVLAKKSKKRKTRLLAIPDRRSSRIRGRRMRRSGGRKSASGTRSSSRAALQACPSSNRTKRAGTSSRRST